jgi:ABC-type antimicrobial peptide transport system permease subunit
MSYAVAERTREIGIRVAIGAEPRDLKLMILRQGWRLSLGGAALGLAGALGLARLLRSQLYDVSATDPLTFGAVALSLIVVSLLACWIPARRATKVSTRWSRSGVSEGRGSRIAHRKRNLTS